MQHISRNPRFLFSGLPAFAHTAPAYTGIPYEQVFRDRQKYMPKFYFNYYKEPLLIHHGKRQYLYDHKGERYLDLISGISTVVLGHSHPEISRVIRDQSEKVVHTSTFYLNQYQTEYSKMLCKELGDDYDQVYMCNSGGEANDFAINLARIYTQTHKIVSLRNGYHGFIGNAACVTNIGAWNPAAVRGVEFEKLAWPSSYRGSCATVDHLIKDAKQALNANTHGSIAGFIFQCVQGVGGINPLPDGYLPQMANLVKQYNGLLICDEVQTGFGRIGKQFWGHKWQGIKPDIITLAKGIGNGAPMGAVVTRKEIAKVLNYSYLNTYGGGPLQCRIGMEVIKAIHKEKLAENAERLGDYFLVELKKLQQKHRFLGEIRGKGLMVGIEIVKDKETKEPGKEETNTLMELTKKRQILFGKGGVFGNVLRIQPPLCMTMEDAKYTVQALDDCLNEMK